MFTDDSYYALDHNLVLPYLTKQFNSDVGKAEYGEYYPEQAKKMFEELGYDGEDIVMITTRDYEEQYNVSVIVQEQPSQTGLNVKLEVYNWPALLERTENSELYNLNIMEWEPQPEPTSYGFLRRGHDSGWVDNDEFDH